MIYEIPEEYLYRLIHIRPRFKVNVEQVLISMASEVAKLEKQPKDVFAHKLEYSIREFEGNLDKSQKTINNWRTEISALFGFIQTDQDGLSYAGARASELADKQDLVQFFKTFLYFFQYPGGHGNLQTVKSILKQGIKFHPASYILSLLTYSRQKKNSKEHVFGITKAEACHCIFNDLRVTTGQRSVKDTWLLILHNRSRNMEYDTRGDIIRYAGDILDYMVLANLLIAKEEYYYMNDKERSFINFIMGDIVWHEYHQDINDRDAWLSYREDWFAFVNQRINLERFRTDISILVEGNKNSFIQTLIEEDEEDTLSTKDIGDIGERLVLIHEKLRLKREGLGHLVHLVKSVPTEQSVGYDIQSIDEDENFRYIEVKTTISANPLEFFRVKLTSNEWRAAETHKEKYYVYRLMISKESQRLFILNDPVRLYKEGMMRISPRQGMEIRFNEKSGEDTELLS